VYNYKLHRQIKNGLESTGVDIAEVDNLFYTRFVANASSIKELFNELYGHRPDSDTMFDKIISTIATAWLERSSTMKEKDDEKEAEGHWFLSNKITGMSLYVDRFCGNLENLGDKLSYFRKLGVNLLHLMPLFQSPEGESDGGYAVSDFRKVDPRFGTLDALKKLQQKMDGEDMFLMLDIVLNHTSHHHEWARKAKAGDAVYQDYFYMYPDRSVPDQFDAAMPDIFPESSPGNFTSARNAGSFSFSGCNSFNPFCTAYCLTSERCSFCPLPAGLSGAVITAAMS